VWPNIANGTYNSYMGKGNDTQTRDEIGKKAQEDARKQADLAIMSELSRETAREGLMTTLGAKTMSEQEMNNIMLQSQTEILNRLSEEEKQKMRNRDEETLRKVKVQLDAKMVKEIQDFTQNAELERRNRDEAEIIRLKQERVRIAAEVKERRDKLENDLKMNRAKEKEVDDLLRDALEDPSEPKEPARQPKKSTQACCSLF